MKHNFLCLPCPEFSNSEVEVTKIGFFPFISQRFGFKKLFGITGQKTEKKKKRTFIATFFVYYVLKRQTKTFIFLS